MYQGMLVLAQVMAHLPLSAFRRCVATHRGDHKVRGFSCLDQFFAMAFAQLTSRESLRDIEVNLRAQTPRLYHMGFRCKTISRNTLANANATRPWQMYADFAQHLIGIARPLYANEPLAADLDATVYAFDATTVDLCLSVYPWAPFRSTKAAIKLHTLLDIRSAIPSFIHITNGKTHEANILDDLVIEPGAYYLMGRGYLDFARLYAIHQAQAFFVNRAKSNTKFKRRYSHPVDRLNTNVLCDQTGVLTIFYFEQRLSRNLAPRGREGRGDRQAHHVPDQQLCFGAHPDRRPVSAALAGRVVLQVDQAAPAHQGVSWHQREPGEDANLDRRLRLRANRDHQEASQAAA